MSDSAPNPFQPVLFFISRVFILIGMVLVFTFVSIGVAMLLGKVIFGVDVVQNPGILNAYEGDPKVLSVLKFVQFFNTIGGFLIPAFLFPRALRYNAGYFLHSKPARGVLPYLIAIVMMLISIPLVSAAISWNEAYTFPASFASLEHQLREAQASAEALTKAFIRSDTTGVFLLNLVLVAILPAICEEFFFRGALMRFLMMVLRSRHLAIALTALIFSVLHGEFYGILPRFILGLFLGYIAYYTGSLWPAIGAHFLNNGLALTGEYLHLDESGISVFAASYSFPIYAVIISTVGTIGLIYLLWLRRDVSADHNGE